MTSTLFLAPLALSTLICLHTPPCVDLSCALEPQEISSMLPALAEIVSNVVGLQLDNNITAAILGAVLAPLLRSEPPERPHKRAAGRLRTKRRSAPRRKRKYKRHAPTDARDRALAALRAKPGVTLTEIAKIARVSRSTVATAARELAKEARKRARKEACKPRETPKPAPTDRQQRAQRFLKDTLAHGPKRAADVEEAAEKAHVDPVALTQARTALGILASRANAGGVQAVQWSLPG
jgi:hypothetical protein